MKTFGSKMIAAAMTAILAIGFCPSLAFASEGNNHAATSLTTSILPQGSTIASGNWGTCPWEITDDGRLTVHPGTGGVSHVSAGNDSLGVKHCSYWYDYRDSIKSIVFVSEGENKAIAPEDSSFLFAGLSSVESIDLSSLDTSSVTSMANMFSALDDIDFEGGYSALTQVNLFTIDTANVIDMHEMFSGCSALQSLDLSTLDTSNVENMRFMFAACSALETVNLEDFSTASATDIAYMFYGCSSLTSIDLSRFQTASVLNMEAMFSGCSSLTSLDISSFDTSNMYGMGRLFENCSSLEVIFADESWTTARVGDSTGMDSYWWPYDNNVFLGCTKLVGGNGTPYEARHATDCTYARIDADETPGYFTHVSDKAKTPITAADIMPIANQQYTGTEVLPETVVTLNETALTPGTDYKLRFLNNVNTGTATVIAVGTGDYRGATQAEFNIIPPEGLSAAGKWGTCSWEIDGNGVLTVAPGIGGPAQAWYDDRGYDYRASYWYRYQDQCSITQIVFQESDGQKAVAPTDCSQLFANLTSLKTLDLAGLDTSQTTSMASMFDWCLSLQSVDFSQIDLSNVTTLAGMFYTCASMQSFDLSACNTSSVESMESMFHNCYGLLSVDVRGINTSSLSNTEFMFYGCGSLERIDLSGFNTSNVQSFFNMFENCAKLKTIYVGSGWSIAEASNTGMMFAGCTSLVGGNGTTYTAAHVDGEYARIDTDTTPGYLTDAADLLKPSIANATITLEKASSPYTGTMQKGVVKSVKLDDVTLTEGQDYTVNSTSGKDVNSYIVTVTGKGAYTGTKSATFKIVAADLNNASISGLTNLTYNGKPQTPAPTVTMGSRALVMNTDYMVSFKGNTNAGTATVIATGKGNYTGSKSVTFKINKAKQPMTAKAVNKTAKVKTLKKKAVTLTKFVTVKKKQGALSYKNVSTQKAAKKFKINAKKGTMTVPKGTKKGTYKVKVKVTAKGNANYNSGSKTVTVTVKVK